MTATTQHSSMARWRVVDIVVAAVIAVAFGVVFAGWNAAYAATGPLFTWFPPAQAVFYGMWLVPGVLGALVVRRPGAAVFTELLAAVVSMFVFGGWGLIIALYGLLQGLLPEAVFAATRYRRWSLPVVLAAGAAAGLVPAVLDNLISNAKWALSWQLAYGVLVVASSVAMAGLGAYALIRALARTGVLANFPAGRVNRS